MKSIFHPDPPRQLDRSRLIATASQAARRNRIPGIQLIRSGHVTTPRGSYNQVPAWTGESHEDRTELENQPLAVHEEPAPYFDMYELYQPSDIIGPRRETARFKKEREWERWKSTLPSLVDTYRQLLWTTDSLRQQPVLHDRLNPCLCASAKLSSVTLILMDSKLNATLYPQAIILLII